MDISEKATSKGKQPSTAELTINSADGFAKTLTNQKATVEFENKLLAYYQPKFITTNNGKLKAFFIPNKNPVK